MSLDTTLTSTEPAPVHTLSRNTFFKDTDEDIRKYRLPYLEKALTKLKNKEYRETRKTTDEIQTASETRPSPIPRTSINSYCSTFVMALIRTGPSEAKDLTAHFNHPYNWQCWLPSEVRAQLTLKNPEPTLSYG